ncbi:MAG: hypothetical protein IKV35_06570 [Clostridia bacterium]|nr:hypothetical protein [Clostridia bacterium]
MNVRRDADDSEKEAVMMRKSLCTISRMVAAFGIGVLLSIVFSGELMLTITVIVLIALSICGSICVRG